MANKFTLVTAGRMRLLGPDGRDVVYPEKGLLAICLLLECPGFERSRSQLARFLWGDAAATAARVNLRKMISRVRRCQDRLGVTLVAFDARRAILDRDALESDFTDLQGGSTVDSLDRMRKALRLVSEEFLEDVVPTSGAAKEWIEAQRSSRRERLREIFLGSLKRAEAERRFELIKQFALCLLEKDPHDELVRAALVRARALEGDPLPRDPSLPAAAGTLPVPPWRAERTVEAEPQKDVPQQEAREQRRLPRLVLLPPAVAVGSEQMRDLSHGLVEDATIVLCALNTVSVVAPYSASRIGSESDKTAAFDRYKIDYVFDCRVSGSAGGRSMFGQLVRFANDEVIWAGRYSLEAAGLVEGRREIVENLAMSIAEEIDRNELTRERFAANPSAYRLFLLGQSNLKHVDLPRARRARKFFRGALREQPNYAPALSGMARSLFMEWLLTARGDDELLREAERQARLGIEAGENLATGYRELGVIRLYQWAFDESLEALEQAERRGPQYANVIASHADTLVQSSRPLEGLEKIERSIELNPLCPDDYLWTAAGGSYSSGRYALALSYIERMKDRSPADRLSAASWAMLGDVRKARHFVRRTRAALPEFDVDKWLEIVPFRESWQKDHYREGLIKAGY